METFRKGAVVAWTWGQGTGRGKIKQKFTEDVERTIKGTVVKRKADAEEPAYLVEQEDGGLVLKSHSELRGTASR